MTLSPKQNTQDMCDGFARLKSSLKRQLDQARFDKDQPRAMRINNELKLVKACEGLVYGLSLEQNFVRVIQSAKELSL
jgi:hypothetical protein